MELDHLDGFYIVLGAIAYILTTPIAYGIMERWWGRGFTDDWDPLGYPMAALWPVTVVVYFISRPLQWFFSFIFSRASKLFKAMAEWAKTVTVPKRKEKPAKLPVAKVENDRHGH